VGVAAGRPWEAVESTEVLGIRMYKF
jgi:hypothetical protein